MKIVDKYLLRELLVSVLYCLAAFYLLYIVYDLFDNLARFIEAATPVSIVLRYYGALLLAVFEYLAPASLLLGTLYTLWQLTRHNELTAMRASGVGFLRIMTPFLAVGFVVSILTGVLKETVTLPAAQWAADLAVTRFEAEKPRMVEHLAYYNSRDRRLWLIEQMDLKRPGTLIRPRVTLERDDGTRKREIVASRAEWLDGQWWLFDPRVQEFGPDDNPIGPFRPPAVSEHLKEMPQLGERPAEFANEIKSWEFLTLFDMLAYLRTHAHLSDEALIHKRFDLHQRIAMPWACFIVTLFGIPAGVLAGKHHAITGVFLALSFFLGFYALSQIGVFLGKRGEIPVVAAAWLSNLVFLAAGIIMIRRVK